MAAAGTRPRGQSCGNCSRAPHPATKKGRINASILSAPARCAKSDRLLEYINYAIRLSPRDPILTYWLNFAGRAELELHHDGSAIGYFRRGIALTPRHPGTLAALAAAHALSGNVSEARTYLSELQKAAPQLSPEKLI